MANLKELLSRPLPQSNSNRSTLLVVVGGYLMYMAYQMVTDTLSGASAMSLTATVILAGIMGLGGLGTIVYGVLVWRAASRAGEKSSPETKEKEA